jgi:hypothetical protein
MIQQNYYDDLLKQASESRPDPLAAHTFKQLFKTVAVFSTGMTLSAIGLALHLPFWLNATAMILTLVVLAFLFLRSIWDLLSYVFRRGD